MNILVAQFYTDNVRYGEYAEKINRAYCEKHNYQYIVEKDSVKIRAGVPDRHPTWYKPILIKECFEQYNPDWILFLDIDAIFSDFNTKIDEFIDTDYNIIASDDIGHHSDFNAGVLLIKNSEESLEFLNTWFSSGETFTGNDAEELQIRTLLPQHLEQEGTFKQALWHDQTCLTLLSRQEKYKSYFKRLKRSIFNHDEFNQGNFIFHAYGKGHHPYRTLDIVYKTIFPQSEENFEKINLIVYHIFCTGNYLEVVKQQLDRLISTGLYDWSSKIHATCINLSGDFSEIENLLEQYPKVELYKYTTNDYEYQGIKAVWTYSQNYSGQVLYFHTKGVSNRYVKKGSNEVSQRKSLGVDIWKELLEYFLIDKFQICLDKLKEVDQVGLTNVNTWWWGNFWWANLSNVRIQSQPSKGDRWSYEAWLNVGRAPKIYEHSHFTWNPYFTTLPVEYYINKFSSPVEIVKAEYGTLGIQQDEGKSFVERTTNDVTEIVKNNFKKNQSKKIHIRVDNTTFGGDPLWGHVKSLDVELKVDGKSYFIVADEGQSLDINFYNE